MNCNSANYVRRKKIQKQCKKGKSKNERHYLLSRMSKNGDIKTELENEANISKSSNK